VINSSLLVSLLTGAIGALVAIVLTPWTQHFFWSLARRAEIRFTTIIEINNLWAAFLHHAILREQGRESLLSDDFFSRLDASSAQIRALFSSESLDAFNNVHTMIGHGINPNVPVHDFVSARQQALSDLYKAMGITENSIVRRLVSLVR
jgi:hypothetical protein